MIWMAVTADKYELPMIVEPTSVLLAKKRAVVERVLGREGMIIVAIITLLVIAGIGWAICAAIPREPWEDQEQEEFLEEWRKKHK